MPVKPKKKSVRPIDIPLSVGVPFENGSMLVVLPTLDELETFATANMERFPFACGGIDVGDDQTYLRPYDWVFGSSKAAVIATLLRWGQSEIGCEFYEWARHEPGEHENWFRERDMYRADCQAAGTWSEANEAEYQADYTARTPRTYRGWWQFSNLPNGLKSYEWFNPAFDGEELRDPAMDPVEAARRLHEQTFDDWRQSDIWEIEPVDVAGMEKTIRYWRNEQKDGRSYYGDENETTQTR